MVSHKMSKRFTTVDHLNIHCNIVRLIVKLKYTPTTIIFCIGVDYKITVQNSKSYGSEKVKPKLGHKKYGPLVYFNFEEDAVWSICSFKTKWAEFDEFEPEFDFFTIHKAVVEANWTRVF